jgi:hypothetical protein
VGVSQSRRGRIGHTMGKHEMYRIPVILNVAKDLVSESAEAQRAAPLQTIIPERS